MTGLRLLRYILRRLLQAVPVILGVTVLCFLLLQLAPGDLAEVLAGESGGASAEYIQDLRARYGLDKPMLVQLGVYVGNVLFFDLGFSFRHSSNVSDLLLERMVPTLLLMGTTLVLSVGVGVLSGLFAAIWVRTWRDHIISLGAIIAYATPLFWVGLMLILVFSVWLDWFSHLRDGRRGDVLRGVETGGGHRPPPRAARHHPLPVLPRAVHPPHARHHAGAAWPRLRDHRPGQGPHRAADHVSATCCATPCFPWSRWPGSRSAPCSAARWWWRSVFAWPGLGQLAFEALFSRDFNLLLGIFFISACLVVFVNIVVDVIYVLLDPRIKVDE